MKKLFSAIATIILAAAAQTADAQAIMNTEAFGDYRLGVQLGFNIPSFGADSYASTVGWNLGVTGIYNTETFIPNSYLKASALYTRKGASGDDVYYPSDDPQYHFEDATFYLHYLETPIRFGYAYDLDNDFLVFGETGPYLAFRFSGSQRNDKATVKKANGYAEVIDKNGAVSNMNGDMKDVYDDLRRFDIGWGIHAGVMYLKKYELSLGYDWGLCDVVPKETGRNLNLNLNLTVYFD